MCLSNRETRASERSGLLWLCHSDARQCVCLIDETRASKRSGQLWLYPPDARQCVWLRAKEELVRGPVCYGSATPMRGKSLTCRQSLTFSSGLRPFSCGHRPQKFLERAERQVVDLPRIGVAEPEPRIYSLALLYTTRSKVSDLPDDPLLF